LRNQIELKMKSSTKLVLTILHVIAWIIFLGLCVKTGAILYSFFVSLAINPKGAGNIYMGLDLSSLYSFDKGNYVGIVSVMIILSFLNAFLFYLVVKIFLKINFVCYSEILPSLIYRTSDDKNLTLTKITSN